MKKKEQRVSSKNRFQATDDGNVEITMNAKYIEGLVEVLGLEKAHMKKIAQLTMEELFKRKGTEWSR